VFKTAPEWIAQVVPENRNMSYWAPDIIKLGDGYLLYYSVSSIGKMTSAIGLATNPTPGPERSGLSLDRSRDRGETQEGDGYNAIDPSLFHEQRCEPLADLWLLWTGIKLIQLDAQTGKRIAQDSKMYSLAHNDSIEASYLCKHDNYYYLFVNWGSCCQGPRSTYNIRVGRSQVVTGPYLDKVGSDMLRSGGSVFLATTNGPLIGPGHAGTLNAQGKDWFTSDFECDVRMDGKATLAIMPLRWSADCWPEATVNDVKSASPAESGTK
jgi:arabinan endo-1,5-alpha-L-arabinosidase